MESKIMSGGFAIHETWESSLNESPEVNQTSALIKILLGNEAVTRNEDDWSKTVRDEVHLSAYPIAIWLASSWWRLRWEPFPITSTPSLSWRMTHELAAAGYGYVWPRILFASDGKNINIWSAQSERGSNAPVRYLSTAHCSIDAKIFEESIDDFMNSVLARLRATNVEDTMLNSLWAEVIEERNQVELGSQRRLEAMLGFDPDECPAATLELFENLIPKAGASAINEIAPVCATSDPAGVLRTILEVSESDGIVGRVDASLNLEKMESDSSMQVWQHGRSLAQQARKILGLNGDPLSDLDLTTLLGLQQNILTDIDYGKPRMPLGFAILNTESAKLQFFLRKRNKPGRRFELARFLCDYLIAGSNDIWLPVTDAKTARQKIQRAFAADFLCPIEALKSFIGDDLSSDAIDEAAEHFGVAPLAVETQLVNDKQLSSNLISDYGWWLRNWILSNESELDA
jgi:hypothetical protein